MDHEVDRKLAAELTAQGHKVSADTVGSLLREEGFSEQGNAKTIEGRRHPDRDAQFRYINEQVKAHPGTGRRPVLTLAERLLATVLHQRLALPQVAIAALISARPETVNRRIRDIRQLLDQAGHTIHVLCHRI